MVAFVFGCDLVFGLEWLGLVCSVSSALVLISRVWFALFSFVSELLCFGLDWLDWFDLILVWFRLFWVWFIQFRLLFFDLASLVCFGFDLVFSGEWLWFWFVWFFWF